MRDLWQTYIKEVAKYDWGTDEATAHAKKMTPGQNEQNDQDPGEYDQEGDMAKTKLRTIISSAKEMHDMLGTDDNLPEWVQDKITKSEDYITTVRDYMKSESEDDKG